MMDRAACDILANFMAVSAKVDAAARTAGRAGGVKLLLASKKQAAAVMNELIRYEAERGGSVLFGESFVQEYAAKRNELLPPYRCHLIGRLQSNKARDAVALFDVIESVHSARIAEALNKEASRLGKRQDIFLQVNISADPSKAGFSPDELEAFIETQLVSLPALRLCGLMTITAFHADAEEARGDFHAMAALHARVSENCRRHIAADFRLSMGMSGDFETAIQEGSTLVRVGTAVFGERR